MRPTVLFVCIGNVCRSPLAERLLRLRLTEADAGDRFEVGSAGVRAMVGREMWPESARTLIERGGDPAGFTAALCTGAITELSDVVLTATRQIRSKMLEESPKAMRRTFTITEFAALSEAALPDLAVGARDLSGLVEACGRLRGTVAVPQFDIDDPIGRSVAVFESVAEEIDRAVATIASVLVQLDH